MVTIERLTGKTWWSTTESFWQIRAVCCQNNFGMKQLYYSTMPSPIGTLTLLASANGLVAIYMESHVVSKHANWFEDDHALEETRLQLESYFAGQRREFDLPLDLIGTPFQLRVWHALREIPFGETMTYGEQARKIGNSAASRAVGMANGKNPVSIIVPCHRVIGKNGALTGFGGGLERKRFLLDLEQSVLG